MCKGTSHLTHNFCTFLWHCLHLLWVSILVRTCPVGSVLTDFDKVFRPPEGTFGRILFALQVARYTKTIGLRKEIWSFVELLPWSIFSCQALLTDALTSQVKIGHHHLRFQIEVLYTAIFWSSWSTPPMYVLYMRRTFGCGTWIDFLSLADQCLASVCGSNEWQLDATETTLLSCHEHSKRFEVESTSE